MVSSRNSPLSSGVLIYIETLTNCLTIEGKRQYRAHILG